MKKLLIPGIIILGLVAIVMLKIGSIFILLALLPSVVAYYIDRSVSLSTLKTVFACNCAAMLPVIYPMLKAAFLFEPFNAYGLITNPLNWLFAYSGAAAGWALIYLFRFIARLMVAVAYEYQIHALKQTQKNLVKEWGKEIELTGPPTK